jgi:hypothetical protein
LVHIATLRAFFPTCVAYVRGLDRVVRGTERAEEGSEDPTT